MVVYEAFGVVDFLERRLLLLEEELPWLVFLLQVELHCLLLLGAVLDLIQLARVVLLLLSDHHDLLICF